MSDALTAWAFSQIGLVVKTAKAKGCKTGPQEYVTVGGKKAVRVVVWYPLE